MSKAVFEYLVECAVEEIAVYLVRTKKLSEADALGSVYHSDFYTRLTNRKTGLFGESRASLIHLFEKSQAAAAKSTMGGNDGACPLRANDCTVR